MSDGSVPSPFLSPCTRVLTHARQALPEMVQRIFVVLPPSFKRPNAGVPLVVASEAISRSRDTKRRVAPRQAWLRMDQTHHA
jgi:hypothetical protein